MVCFSKALSVLITISSLPLITRIKCQEEADFKQFDECNYEVGDNEPQVIKFANEFQISTEVKKLSPNASEGYTLQYESVGFYTSNGSRGATIITRHGESSRFLYDFVSSVAFQITPGLLSADFACSPPTDLFRAACSPFAYYVAEEAGYENVKENCNMKTMKVKYVKEAEGDFIRGIKSIKWKQCIFMKLDNSDGSYHLLEYYYTQNKSAITAGYKPDGPVPIRMVETELKPKEENSTIAPISYINDFIEYSERPVDEKNFDPPPGVHCPHWIQGGRTEMPKLPSHFTMVTVTKHSYDAKQVLNTVISLDQERKIVVYVTNSGQQWLNPNHKFRKSNETHVIVHDFNTLIAYDATIEACQNISHIDPGSDDVSSQNDTKSLSMRQANDLIDMDNLDFVSYGKRTWNGLDAWLWVGTRNTTFDTDIKYNIEVYFYKLPNNDWVPAAIVTYRFNNIFGHLIDKVTTTISLFNKDMLAWTSFDVSDCLSDENFIEEKPIYVTVQLEETRTNQAVIIGLLLKTTRKPFENAFQKSIAKIMEISPLRVIFPFPPAWADNKTMEVSFTILPAPKRSLLPNKMKEVPRNASDAWKRLLSTTTTVDTPIWLKWGKWQDHLRIKRGSAKVSETPFETSDVPGGEASAVRSGYSGGSMTLLAFIMLATGCAAGIGGAYFVWKKRGIR